MAQVAAALGICTIAGNTYGVDIATMLGTLSHGEFSAIGYQDKDPDVRQIVALPSGMQSREPRVLYIEEGVLKDRGVYVSLLNNNFPLQTELLSPRDRLIVELSDGLVVTEAGNRGAFDTIIWAIEAQKPILAIDWGRTDTRDVRSGCHVLRALKEQAEKDPKEDQPDTLAALLDGPLQAQTTHYHFSSAHPSEKANEVPQDGSGNKEVYQNSRTLAVHLLAEIRKYQSCTGHPLIRLVFAGKVMPPHNGNARDRRRKAEGVKQCLQELISEARRGRS
jgi:predicted Rossmann fold nucleotide-binding protein DprA/Smf involved in DNA uptake